MIFNNLEELFTTLEKLEYEKENYECALKNAIQEQKKYINKKNKEYWNDVISNYKMVLSKYQKEIEKINTIYNNALTFPKELIIPFILECINLYEEEYVTRNLVLSFSIHNTTLFTVPTYSNFQVFFPKNLLEQETKLENTFYISVLQQAYIDLFEQNNVNYIMMPTDGYIYLVSENLNLLNYYKSFPYLKDIGLNLIERRISEPDKKIATILNDELEELKESKTNKNLCK